MSLEHYTNIATEDDREQKLADSEAILIFKNSEALICVRGLFTYCPRCGRWMGSGSEGVGTGAPVSDPLPVPRLIKALSTPRESNDSLQAEVGHRVNKLTRGGILERLTVETKSRYSPPARDGHGRKVDSYYRGEGGPDGNKHGHESKFIRGDNTEVSIYHALPGVRPRTIALESGVDVDYVKTEQAYSWTRKGEVWEME